MSERKTVQKREHLLPPPEKKKGKIIRHKGLGPFDYARKYDLITLLLLFFIFCMIGCLWEIGLHLVEEHALVKRGTMHGPWLPIYGVGGIMMLVFLKRLADRPPVLFFSIMILCAAVEYATSWYLEKTRGAMWWDYRDKLLNLNGRICAEGLLIFGVGGCLIIYIVAPFLAEKLERVPKIAKILILSVLIVCFACDFVYSAKYPNTGEGITKRREDTAQFVPPFEDTAGTKINLDKSAVSGIKLSLEFF